MSDIKLFRLQQGQAVELQGSASDLEKPLQTLIENNLDTLLGIRFLASEYSTGKTHGGRIDSLGLDENNCPVILEYKRSVSENVINQGLFYLDWLMDHQAEFKLLAREKFGDAVMTSIDWSAPRLICIAGDFTKYDGHAVQQINRNIELIRYRMFGNELLLLELANASNAASTAKTQSGSSRAQTASGLKPADTMQAATQPIAQSPAQASAQTPGPAARGSDKSYAEWLEDLPPNLRELLTSLEDYIQSLGDDVQRKELKLYVAFKRLKNFATIVPQKNRLLLRLHLNPDEFDPLPPNARDVRNIGAWGTGNLELSLTVQNDLDAVKALIQLAYEGRQGAAAVAVN